MAFGVVQPPVIGAAEAAIFEEPVVERRAAVRAALAQQAVPAGRLAKDDQLFAHDRDPLDRPLCGQVASNADRVPVATQQLAARRAGPNACQQLVFFFRQHGYLTNELISGMSKATPFRSSASRYMGRMAGSSDRK